MNLYRHRKRNRLDGYNYSQHGWYLPAGRQAL